MRRLFSLLALWKRQNLFQELYDGVGIVASGDDGGASIGISGDLEAITHTHFYLYLSVVWNLPGIHWKGATYTDLSVPMLGTELYLFPSAPAS